MFNSSRLECSSKLSRNSSKIRHWATNREINPFNCRPQQPNARLIGWKAACYCLFVVEALTFPSSPSSACVVASRGPWSSSWMSRAGSLPPLQVRCEDLKMRIKKEREACPHATNISSSSCRESKNNLVFFLRSIYLCVLECVLGKLHWEFGKSAAGKGFSTDVLPKGLRGTSEDIKTPHQWGPEFTTTACPWMKAMALLTFPAVAYGVISEAPSALFEVGARPSSVSGRNRYLATPLGAADATGRRAGRPGTPWSHHAVDGCWESSQISRRPQQQERQNLYTLIQKHY